MHPCIFSAYLKAFLAKLLVLGNHLDATLKESTLYYKKEWSQAMGPQTRDLYKGPTHLATFCHLIFVLMLFFATANLLVTFSK